MNVLRAILRNLHPSLFLNPSQIKRSIHLLGAWGFEKLLRLTGSPVEFHFGRTCCISVGGVLLDYDIRRAGDVLSMDVEGPWEPADLAFVLDHLRTGGTFHDIGANLGWYSLNVMLKTPASTICFEPQPVSSISFCEAQSERWRSISLLSYAKLTDSERLVLASRTACSWISSAN